MSSPKNLRIELLDRSFNDLRNPPKLEIVPNRYSKTINGGCKEAHLTAYGTEQELWNLANMLRYGLYIYNDKQEAVWWGYISEIKIRVGNLLFGATLDTMSNRVAVAYTTFGNRSTTAFAQDNYSVSVYGEKELLSAVSDATGNEAIQRRNSDLFARKLPIPTIEFDAQSEGSFSANIVARGFYETLGWKYYSQEKGLVEHSVNGVGQQNLGVIVSSACLVFNDETNKINSWAEELSGFKKGEIITVSGTSSNNGTFTVSQGSTSGSSITVDQSLSSETAATATVTAASQVAQSFKQTSGSSWDANSIHLRIQPSGSPTDDIVASLYSYSSGSPSSLLVSGSYAASDMQTSMVWTEIPLSASVTLSNNTDYFVSAYRTGVPTSGSDYYKVDMDESLGYENGSFLIKTSNGWIPRITDADMLFKVVGTQEVTKQIREIGNTSGQFLIGTNIDIATGSAVETNQYRDGETTALTEINDLLKVGTKDGLRLIANITPDRRLWISEQTDKDSTSTEYKMTLDGRVKTLKGNEIPNYNCTVGIWAQITQFLPATFDQSFLANPGKFFIEECEYYVQSDTIVPRSLDTSNVWELGKVKEG